MSYRDDAKCLVRQMGDVPDQVALKVFLKPHLVGKRNAEIADKLGVIREWCSPTYCKRTLELAGMQCVRLVSTEGEPPSLAPCSGRATGHIVER